ncbi:hypothetical protein PtB15_6B312 [Puccinia triticina]|nr:hypothetical protein PtB15_6B312 [Puccinia triticina]
MVGVKRPAAELIAEHPPATANPHGLDRRTKAIRSCSSWNSALLHGRRTRGPQWDYATASYHVSQRSAEYYRGVTPIHPILHTPASLSTSPTASSQLPSRPLIQPPDRHHHQHHHHLHPQDGDQPASRPTRLPSQGARPTNPAYPPVHHPAHLQHPHGEIKPAIFPPPPNLTHFQHPAGISPPSAPHPIPRHMSTTPSSQAPERKGEHHPGAYQQQPHSAFSPAPYHPSVPGGYEKPAGERAGSPGQPPPGPSPAPHHQHHAGGEGAGGASRKLYPSSHPFSQQRPSTPASARTHPAYLASLPMGSPPAGPDQFGPAQPFALGRGIQPSQFYPSSS